MMSMMTLNALVHEYRIAHHPNRNAVQPNDRWTDNNRKKKAFEALGKFLCTNIDEVVDAVVMARTVSDARERELDREKAWKERCRRDNPQRKCINCGCKLLPNQRMVCGTDCAEEEYGAK